MQIDIMLAMVNTLKKDYSAENQLKQYLHLYTREYNMTKGQSS